MEKCTVSGAQETNMPLNSTLDKVHLDWPIAGLNYNALLHNSPPATCLN